MARDTSAGAEDAVDRILKQWQVERPDLALEAMATIGRLKRCAQLLQRRLEARFEQFGLSAWEFDVLATLRRSGEPYCLSPSVLLNSLMVSSGTMTHRMQRLESAGWVERVPNPEDARSLLLRLSPQGLALIDQAVEAHVANEEAILAPLKSSEWRALDAGLVALLATLEPAAS